MNTARGEARPVLVTGGAGFIGTNLTARLVADGERVLVFDNLSRAGVTENLDWLRARSGDRLEFIHGDLRDAEAVADAVERAGEVFHLAAQVAVTSSLDDPGADFEVNLRGTLNLLEAIRRSAHRPPLVFTSTNKVYGALDDVALEQHGRRYRPVDDGLRARGIGEDRPLDFHSPYGCSKGGADQYVLDYARSYGLDTLVLRMSCIYGPHQFGNEDQGWVAHFLLRALAGQPVTLYGDGMQVRDILHVDDLVEAFMACRRCMPRLRGSAFNMGGGPGNAVSLLEVLERIGSLAGGMPEVGHAAWRTGDQRYYVSDAGRFAAETGWEPRIGAADGIGQLYRWMREFRVPSGSAVSAAPVTEGSDVA